MIASVALISEPSMAPPISSAHAKTQPANASFCCVLEKADWPYEVLVVSKNIWGNRPKNFHRGPAFANS
jgi:hypothetical protein